MKVFISWSGERSQALAQTLRDWLPLVLHYVEPWLSEADIAAGERWAEAVAKELEASNFGIICVTSENVGSQWVLFEAGALAKSMQGILVGTHMIMREVRHFFPRESAADDEGKVKSRRKKEEQEDDEA